MNAPSNIISLEDARARIRLPDQANIEPINPQNFITIRETFAERVRQIQNRITRWHITAFDLDFGANILRHNDSYQMADILTKLNWCSYHTLSPQISDRNKDHSFGRFALNGWIYEWELVKSINQLGSKKWRMFIDIESVEVFEKSQMNETAD